MSRIYPDAMITLHQAYEMMTVRNQVRGYMTHNTDLIEPEQQAEWFENTYLPALTNEEMCGYIVREDEQPVGYGLITNREGKWWVSGGLLQETRGKGLGKMLFKYMTDVIHDDLQSPEAWLDVRNDNYPARSLYEKLGYAAVSANDYLTVMVHRV